VERRPLAAERLHAAAPPLDAQVRHRLVEQALVALLEAHRVPAGRRREQQRGEAGRRPERAAGEHGPDQPRDREHEEAAEQLHRRRQVTVPRAPGRDAEQPIRDPVEERPQRRERQPPEQQRGRAHGVGEHLLARVARRHVLVAQPERPRALRVLDQPRAQRLHPLGVARAQAPVARDRRAAQRERLRQREPRRQLALARREQVRRLLEQRGLLVRGIVQRHARERAPDRGRQRPRRLARVVLGGALPCARLEGLSHPHEHARAEHALLVEGEPHRHDTRGRDPALAHRPEHDARGARLERRQPRRVVADPFREERDRAARRELVEAAPEGLVVLREVGALVLPPMDGHRAGEIEERADPRKVPERALREEARADSERREQQQRVHQAVVVVRDDDERHALRDPLASLDLDRAEEEVREELRQALHEAVELRSREHAARVDGSPAASERWHTAGGRCPCRRLRSDAPATRAAA
jgi:hypothetical protein